MLTFSEMRTSLIQETEIMHQTTIRQFSCFLILPSVKMSYLASFVFLSILTVPSCQSFIDFNPVIRISVLMTYNRFPSQKHVTEAFGGEAGGNWQGQSVCESLFLKHFIFQMRGLSDVLTSQKGFFSLAIRKLLHCLSLFSMYICQNRLEKAGLLNHVLHAVFKIVNIVTLSELLNMYP